MFIKRFTSCIALTLGLGSLILTGCTTPMVTMDVQIASRLSVSTSVDNPSLRLIPDWGQTIAIVPGEGTQFMDPTFEAIKQALEVTLYQAKFEVIDSKKTSDYQLSVQWSLKPSRVINEVEEVPVMVPGPIIWPRRAHHPWHMGMQTAWVSEVHRTQLYLRTLTLKLYEKNDSLPVYTAIVSHESHCNQYHDAIPYLVRSAINNLYSANGTQKLETVEITDSICQ